jgi:hypothetical protein
MLSFWVLIQGGDDFENYMLMMMMKMKKKKKKKKKWDFIICLLGKSF